MQLRNIIGTLIGSRRTKAGWGLAAVLAAPTLAFGQFAQVQQISYWEHDEAIGADLPVQLDSRVFRVELGFDMFDPSSAQLLDENGGAFVNVMFRPDPAMPWEWAVQNVYESVPDETWFELGNIAYEFGSDFWPNGVLLENCEIVLTLTEEPVPNEPIIVPGEEWPVPVDPRERLQSGQELEGELQLSDEYIENTPWDQLSRKIGTGLPHSKTRTAHSPTTIGPVSEGALRCAPGAAARSARYLSKQYGFELKKSDSMEGPEKLYQDYESAQGPMPKVEGRPLTRDEYEHRHFEAKIRQPVNSQWGLPIRSRDIGATYDSNVYFNSETFPQAAAQMKNAVAHGHAASIDYSWKGKNGKTYYHRAMVQSIEPDGDNFRILLADDGRQGDGVASTRVHELYVTPDGTRWKVGRDGFPEKSGRLYRITIDEYRPRLCDLNDDGVVDGADLAKFLGWWGGPAGGEDDGDFNGDGETNGADLSILLGNWGKTFER